MKKTAIPFFKDKKDLFKFLFEHQDVLIAEKKYYNKHGDGIAFAQNTFFDEKENTFKANTPIADYDKITELKVKIAVNTTNFLDSHGDVHIPGMWKKSLSENGKIIKHLQEHEMKFDKIIADKADLKVYTEKMGWLTLGYNYPGETEVLVFESTIKKSRNSYMFEQYAKGYVDNHSVGMGYGQVVLCINDDSYGAEYEAWQKYFPMVANSKRAEDKGYFWAVKEGRCFEGSAVPVGSNTATPTIDNNMKSEPEIHSPKGPEQTTPKINYDYLLRNIENLKL